MPKYFVFDKSLSEPENWSRVQLPFSEAGPVKVLFILDKMPREDMEAGKLLSGVTGDILSAMLQYAKKKYVPTQQWFSWAAISWAAYRTYGKTDEYVDQAHKEFTDRCRSMIARYKPDYVVGFGTDVQDAFLSEKLTVDQKGNTRYSYWLGVPVQCKVKEHSFKFVSNLSLDIIARGSFSEAFMLGYMSRCLLPVFGKRYSVDNEKLSNHKAYLLDSVKKVEKLFETLVDKKTIAIDTETQNLNRITNKTLTIQWAYDQEKAFIVPLYHKDTPFSPRELAKVVQLHKEFLETKHDSVHVYANAKFDLLRIRNDFGVTYYANDVADIFAGEFALDENYKTLSAVLGEWYYSLANISVQYGFEGYLDAKFGKADRTNIANVALTEDVLHYMGLDVVVPLAIFEQQRKHADDIKYKKWLDVVRYDISDTIHAFTEMEHTGALVDVPHLFYLRTKGSPIEKVIEDMEHKLYTAPAAIKANKLICKQLAIPTTGMFNQQTEFALKLSKPEHKQTLFFKVLKLKPIEVGKSGAGKVDKAFQTAYSSVPEVAMFTSIEKAKKLKNAYVKSFISLLGESTDFQADYRIRPTFHFLRVVTHRGASANPNLQNIPTHSPLAKHIKRMFVARAGTLYVKVDYKAHEVRGWGIISSDSAIAELFGAATKLVDAYRAHPTSELAKRLKTEADIHIQNAAYFFKKTIAELVADKEKKDRSAVKGVVFGLIYQKSVRKLAEELGRELEWMQALVSKFFKRFPNGMKWLDNAKATSKKNLYIEAPSGIRRNLWGYLLPESHEEANMVHSKMARQACNCISGDSLIDTDTGLYRIKNLVGTQFNVRVKTGKYSHAPVCVSKGVKKTLRVVTKLGIEQRATPDHEVYVLNKGLAHVWKPAAELATSDFLCVKVGGKFNPSTSMVDGVPMTSDIARSLAYGNFAAVPDCIINASEKHAAIYLSGLFSVKGYYHEEEIRLCNAAWNFLSDIQVLLLKFGIVSTKGATSALIIGRECIPLFLKKIGFYSTNKMASAVADFPDYFATEDVANEAYLYTQVVSVAPAGEEEVFDIAVPGPEHFLSNMCVIHNSPIQGYCSRMMMSGIRLLSKKVYDAKKRWPDFVFHISNSVHDSLENEVGYKHFLFGLGAIEDSLTKDMVDKFYKLHNFKMNSVPEIEFEIGPHLSATETWDFSAATLERIVMKSLLIQRDTLKHNLDVAHAMETIFHQKAVEIAPAWFRQQLKNTGYKFGLTEKAFIAEMAEEARQTIAIGEKLLAENPQDSKAQATVNSGKELLETAHKYEQRRRSAKG